MSVSNQLELHACDQRNHIREQRCKQYEDDETQDKDVNFKTCHRHLYWVNAIIPWLSMKQWHL